MGSDLEFGISSVICLGACAARPNSPSRSAYNNPFGARSLRPNPCAAQIGLLILVLIHRRGLRLTRRIESRSPLRFRSWLVESLGGSKDQTQQRCEHVPTAHPIHAVGPSMDSKDRTQRFGQRVLLPRLRDLPIGWPDLAEICSSSPSCSAPPEIHLPSGVELNFGAGEQ